MRNIFVYKVCDYIRDNTLIAPNDTILVGLSGGADSVALLLLLNELGYHGIAAHCNFHLRGEESNRDEQFCKNLCATFNIKLLKKDFDVDGCRKVTGESVEMACRTLRYDWWRSIIESGEANLIAVGHHREDNIETFFINMLRGCGIQGLKGMLPKSGNIIRPLLESTRVEIEQYLSDKGVGYVIDSTNNENEYRRNRLRNVILPEIEKYFPGASSSISKTISCIRGNYELYSDSIDYLRHKYVSAEKGINISRIVTEERHPRMVLFELISPMGFNMTHVNNILASFDENGKCDVSGRYFNADDISLLLNRGYLTICEPSSTAESESVQCVNLNELPFHTDVITKEQFDLLRKERMLSSRSLYFDSGILNKPHTFTVRNWEAGDRLAPFGMNGTKLLSDIFNDAKLSVEEKKQVKVLLCDDRIIWVIGLRASRYFPVTEKTSHVLVVSYENC